MWDRKRQESFEDLKREIINLTIIRTPYLKEQFRVHVDSSQTAVGGTFTEWDGYRRDIVIVLFSKNQSNTEVYYTVNDSEILVLITLLKRLRWFIECSEFEIITDNQVLTHIPESQAWKKRSFLDGDA